jgi:hypothetical protein
MGIQWVEVRSAPVMEGIAKAKVGKGKPFWGPLAFWLPSCVYPTLISLVSQLCKGLGGGAVPLLYLCVVMCLDS